jgi:hypothetical protein
MNGVIVLFVGSFFILLVAYLFIDYFQYKQESIIVGIRNLIVKLTS